MNRFRFNPMWIVIIFLMAFSSLRQYSGIMDWLMHIAIVLPGVIIGLSFHEFAHAAMANALGDPTAKNQGRLTVNPMAHFDPFGFLALIFLGFGWGVPVPVNPYNLKKQRRDDILISIAGVCMNFAIAVIFAAIYLIMFKRGFYPSLDAGMGGVLSLLVISIMQINLVLLVFNLFPIPPLDGYHVVAQIFKFSNTPFAAKIEEHGFLILILLLILGVVDLILSPAVGALTGAIFSVLGKVIV